MGIGIALAAFWIGIALAALWIESEIAPRTNETWNDWIVFGVLTTQMLSPKAVELLVLKLLSS